MGQGTSTSDLPSQDRRRWCEREFRPELLFGVFKGFRGFRV